MLLYSETLIRQGGAERNPGYVLIKRRSERAEQVRSWQQKIVAAIEINPGREFPYPPRRKILPSFRA
jgi:hypothetical protein